MKRSEPSPRAQRTCSNMAFFGWLSDNRPVLVTQTVDDLQFMLKQGQEIFVAATGRLLMNEILDVDLDHMDREINAREQHIRSTALDFLHASPGPDLVPFLKLLSIVQEGERIGDLGKSIARTADLAQQPRLGTHVLPLRELRENVLELFEMTRLAFTENDESIARTLLEKHEALKERVAAYLATLAVSESHSSNEALVYGLAARMMGRISSHLANIASTVVYPFEQIRRTFIPNEDEGGRADV